MTIASNPLLSELVLEGIKKAGEFNPSPDLITRATTQWIEEIKNDIWMLAKKPKMLQVTSYTVINQGQSRYAYPSDYSSDLSLSLLTGRITGTCTGGAINTVTLQSNDGSDATVIGKEIMMMSGASVGSIGQIVSFNTGTKVASVVPDFNTAPVSGDSYMIIDYVYPVETRPIFNKEMLAEHVIPDRPRYLYPQGDDQQGYFLFDCPPNIQYGARLRYYADLSQIDSNSDLMSVLYRRWRNIWLEGIKMKKIMDEDDDRAQLMEASYRKNLMSLIYREIYGMDISNITDRVTDYW